MGKLQLLIYKGNVGIKLSLYVCGMSTTNFKTLTHGTTTSYHNNNFMSRLCCIGTKLGHKVQESYSSVNMVQIAKKIGKLDTLRPYNKNIQKCIVRVEESRL